MTDIAKLDSLFFERTGMDSRRVETLVGDALSGADDGELYLEYRQSESFAYDDSRLKSASFDTTQGFGLRAVSGEATGYGHASELSEAAITRAGKTVKSVRHGMGTVDVRPRPTNQELYEPDNPLQGVDFTAKVKLLQDIDSYARNKDRRVRQVMASLTGNWQAVEILRTDGARVGDIRPLVRLSVSVVVEDGKRKESGSYGSGGRHDYTSMLDGATWRHHVDEALRQALILIEAEAAPAGEMPVVLGSGWPGILLHEAIGHGLEGDFNRKETSVFSGLMGARVGAPGVTVIDDGTIAARRGSLSIDDEGTPTQRTPLIEDGILVGYMHDRLNARLMGTKSTGNGRRQSFAHQPMPRMRNTIMLGGEDNPEDIIRGIDKGLFAVNFGGGQVDITSGKFVFSASEAYRIEGGKVGTPVKGATLIGTGHEVLKNVRAIANDMELDPGIGTCGKNGQGVPVGVGQPTVLVEGLTVGGTEAE
ncbi:MAG: metalloprotease TldD [Alphaproteobacteria bacterium]|jgi:TldD protein|nr:metalloprotease TldD [Alphaproteobacteria bacterium]MDP7172025.1 metalloprotease TldD [Alphaproteobacteria bacterium]MDP7234617.1 metalloprotease TldD [Alphaproteobacteria bacterium]MDP7488361.1 metalloprotease TldD [Alphaproteobacteria bacterium]HJN21275.1 metalloprotease TldD [Alphaproteobacteria bacterium]|tara:strand:- start:380 stop:1813 length:1434 start_codon:yes stop_codon:yes gene_type:complete